MSASADAVIRATNLKKVYRLYAKPAYRFLDMFGLLSDTPGAFTEHAAAMEYATSGLSRTERATAIQLLKKLGNQAAALQPKRSAA